MTTTFADDLAAAHAYAARHKPGPKKKKARLLRAALQLASEGHSHAEIGDRIGVDRATVRIWLQRPSHPSRRRQLKAVGQAIRSATICHVYDNGYTLRETGDLLGVSHERVSQILHAAGRSARPYVHGHKRKGVNAAARRAGTPRRCLRCRKRLVDGKCNVCERRTVIERLWAAGDNTPTIAAKTGMTKGTANQEIHRMRQHGWNMPYRRPAITAAQAAFRGEDHTVIEPHPVEGVNVPPPLLGIV